MDMQQIAAISHTKVKPYTLTIGSNTVTFDMNIFSVENNLFTNIYGGANGAPVFTIQGFMKVSIYKNTFLNNGRHVENALTIWTKINLHRSLAFDSFGGFCTPSRTADSPGFISLRSAMKLDIIQNTVENHFFSSTGNVLPSFASFILMGEIYGPVTITDTPFTKMTGALGDYNVNTLGTLLSGFTNSATSYYLVPMIATDGSNGITKLTLNNPVMND